MTPIIRTIAKAFPGAIQPLSRNAGRSEKTYQVSPGHLQLFRPWFIRHITWRSRNPSTTGKTSGDTAMGGMPRHELMDAVLHDHETAPRRRRRSLSDASLLPRRIRTTSRPGWSPAVMEKTTGSLLHSFPKDRLYNGPKQIVARINQVPRYHGSSSLWEQRAFAGDPGDPGWSSRSKFPDICSPLYLRQTRAKIRN